VAARGLGWAKGSFADNSARFKKLLEEMNYTEPPYSEKYPMLLTLLDDEPAVPKYNKYVNNVSYGGRWFDLYDRLDFSVVTMKNNLIADPVLCRWLRKGEDGFKNYNFGDKEIIDILKNKGNMLIDGDPGFIDSSNENFQLKEDSPAFKLGFERIPVEKIGLYLDEYRTSLPE